MTYVLGDGRAPQETMDSGCWYNSTIYLEKQDSSGDEDQSLLFGDAANALNVEHGMNMENPPTQHKSPMAQACMLHTNTTTHTVLRVTLR